MTDRQTTPLHNVLGGDNQHESRPSLSYFRLGLSVVLCAVVICKQHSVLRTARNVSVSER